MTNYRSHFSADQYYNNWRVPAPGITTQLNMRRNWIKVNCIFIAEEEYGQHIQKLCEKLHYTRNNKELWYNLTIFEDQTLATV